MGRRSKDNFSCVKWLEISFIHKRSVVDSVVLKAQVSCYGDVYMHMRIGPPGRETEVVTVMAIKGNPAEDLDSAF